MNGDTCDQCEIPFENSNVFIELNIETTRYTHTLEFCCAQCTHTWLGNHMRDDDE